MKSLAEELGVIDPRPEEKRPTDDFDALIDVTEPKEFCARVVASREFRQYILSGIVLGDLPPAVMTRIIDHAWGKPVDRVEHTGRVETVTEVRRVIIRVDETGTAHEEEQELKPTLH